MIYLPLTWKIHPCEAFSKRLKNNNTVKASYNRRIQRPSIRYLNPNIQRQNNLDVTVGNPELAPEYTNNFELSYSTLLKGLMLNISGFARLTNDGIQSVRVPDVIDGVTVLKTTYENIGMDNAYGTSIFMNVNAGKLSLNGGTDVYYSTLDNNNPVDSLRASNEGVVASGRIFGSYNLSKGWGAQFFSFYRGRQVQLQGTQGGFYMYSLGFRKEFNEKRGSIGFAAENFLQPSIKMRTNIESPLLKQTRLNTRNNLSFRITFSYRLGKMSMDDKPRRRRSINNDDLKDDGGDAGMQMGEGVTPQGGNGQSEGRQRMPAPAVQNSKPSRPAVIKSDSVSYEAAGKWNYTIDSPQGGGGVITLNKNGSEYSGTIRRDRMNDEIPLNNVTVNGNEITFSYPATFGGNTITINVQASISKDEMTGTMRVGEMRTFNLMGKRSE